MKPIIIKIGGSTLGSADTTIEDLVSLQKAGVQLAVIHGGGKLINDWLDKLDVATTFVNGLRVTDLQTLRVVCAVLAGLVNKEIVSKVNCCGGQAIGLSGVDGNMVQAKNITKELGYTGEELTVSTTVIKLAIKNGYIPVISPICAAINADHNSETCLMNVNADTIAAEIASAMGAEKLIFLTDVPGIYDKEKKLIPQLTSMQVKDLVRSGAVSGGMIAKIEACISAINKVPVTRIIDGRVSHALCNELIGKGEGTTIVR